MDEFVTVCTPALGKAVPHSERKSFMRVANAELDHFIEEAQLEVGDLEWCHTFTWRDHLIFVGPGCYKEHEWVILLDLGEYVNTGKTQDGKDIMMPRGLSEKKEPNP